MIGFTICSKNFFGYAHSLHTSLRQQHPNIRFYVALCDDVAGFDCAGMDFEVILLDCLGIPNIQEMQSRYNITELNTSIKPFVFLYLFDQHPGEPILYLDPDILVTSRLAELEVCLEQGANCVLTPHILEPAEFAESNDRQFLIYGIYNLGFCALRDTPEVRRAVSWWARRLETQCLIDLANGIFVDQKWADLLPSFIPNTVILRHQGYNVAYWNLSQRRVRLSKHGWTANSEKLRFFHFSGNKIEDSTIFSRHSSQFNVDNIGDLALLLHDYRRSVNDHGHPYYSALPYGFDWNGSGEQNEHTPLSVSLDRTRQTGAIPYLPVRHVQSSTEFDEVRAQLANVIAQRFQIECTAIPSDEEAYVLPGFCACCGHESTFQVSAMYSSRRLPDGRVFPNWREHLDCLSCGLVNRVRASLHILHQMWSPDREARVYMTERKTLTYDWMAGRYPHLQGSEYFGSAFRPGEIVNGIRHENVQGLSFADGSFEFILTFDVLEHVPDPMKAMREFFRCLSPGGVLMITVPFSWRSEAHVIRAVLSADGDIEHLMEPEYHGNPVDMEGGSLCFRYFGWQLLQDLRDVGFANAEVLNYWSEQLRYFGDPQFVITAHKSGRSASSRRL